MTTLLAIICAGILLALVGILFQLDEIETIMRLGDVACP